MKISKVMHKIVVIGDDISLKEAAKIMSKKKIGSLIYVEKGAIKGILTERDIMKNISHLNKKISKIISKKVKVIDVMDSLEDAAKMMSKYKIKRLPVVDGDELVGIITATDLVAHTDGFDLF